MKLSPKRGLFIYEYLVDGNGTRAAVAAGYAESSAAMTASRLLRDPEIAAVIEARQQKRVEKLEITADRVLEELAKLAFYDPRKIYDGAGNVKPIGELDDVTAAAICGMDVDTVETSKESADGESTKTVRTITRKFKLADKGQNLERLGKHFKLFTDNINHSGKMTLEELVTGAAANDSAS